MNERDNQFSINKSYFHISSYAKHLSGAPELNQISAYILSG